MSGCAVLDMKVYYDQNSIVYPIQIDLWFGLYLFPYDRKIETDFGDYS